MYCGQKLGEDFAKFCGLLRIYELYKFADCQSFEIRDKQIKLLSYLLLTLVGIISKISEQFIVILIRNNL
jgi:hypothetical protein